jgi:hypothetical protein
MDISLLSLTQKDVSFGSIWSWHENRLLIWQRYTKHIVAALVFGSACRTGSTTTPGQGAAGPLRVANLHTFARLYGVVRWFHPSDAAAAIDWDRFAIEGARRAIDASSASALRAYPLHEQRSGAIARETAR